MCPDSAMFGTHMFDMMLAATVTSLYYQYVVSAEQHALIFVFFSHVLPVGKWCNVSLKSLCNIVYII